MLRPIVANVTNVIGVENGKGLDPDDIAERAAIVAEGSGAPDEWAEGYAKMLSMNPPQGFTARQWQAAIDSAGRFIDEWASKVAGLGWTAEEVFGVHPRAAMADHSCRGLAYYLKDGKRIIAVTADTATIETRSGARTTVYRETVASGGVPAWRLDQKDRKDKAANDVQTGANVRRKPC